MPWVVIATWDLPEVATQIDYFEDRKEAEDHYYQWKYCGTLLTPDKISLCQVHWHNERKER